MEEGCQKSKRLSCRAKFKREGVQCTEENGNCKPLQFLELKATVGCGRNTKQCSATVRHHERNSLEPSKEDFLKLNDKVFMSFQERDGRLA
jgi:hypothetical protein